ncbi:hypothetical protein Pelo_12704 [Pelomyxa schiedti]|nr:hypothetical protein Pelo_12704 [Pelomyxa schiedti]
MGTIGPTLARAWADEWVFGPSVVDDAVFEVPLQKNAAHAKRRSAFVCVSVSSTTMGVVAYSVFWCGLTVCGCVGQSRVLVRSRGAMGSSDTGFDYSVLNLGDTAESPRFALFTAPGMSSMRCNRSWVVGIRMERERDALFVRKLLCSPNKRGECLLCGFNRPGTIPDNSGISGRIRKVKFSPLSDGVAMVLNYDSLVSFVDLEASFTTNTLVTTINIVCGEIHPRGVMWLSSGTPLKPVGKNHAFVSEEFEPTQFQVYHTDNLTAPSLCVPCTWVHITSSSSLILSTQGSYTPYQHSTSTLQFTLHDGISGLKVGDFNILLPPDVMFDKNLR